MKKNDLVFIRNNINLGIGIVVEKISSDRYSLVFYKGKFSGIKEESIEKVEPENNYNYLYKYISTIENKVASKDESAWDEDICEKLLNYIRSKKNKNLGVLEKKIELFLIGRKKECTVSINKRESIQLFNIYQSIYNNKRFTVGFPIIYTKPWLENYEPPILYTINHLRKVYGEKTRSEFKEKNRYLELYKNGLPKKNNNSKMRGFLNNFYDSLSEFKYNFISENTEKSITTESDITPSFEQKNIIEGVKAGHDIKIQAFAGTGKTTTLLMVAKQFVDKKVVLIAFNKRIVSEAKSKLKGYAEAYTAHSLAYKNIITSKSFKRKFEPHKSIYNYRNILTALEIKIKDHIKLLDFNLDTESRSNNIEETQDNDQALKIAASKMAYPIRVIIKDYLKKESIKVSDENIPESILNNITKYYKEIITLYSKSKPINTQVLNNHPISPKGLAAMLLDLCQLFVSSVFSELSDASMDFDFIMKLWSIKDPSIDADLILVDECQDLDPLILNIIKRQSAQKVWVGDKYQQIYTWRGAINALDAIGDIPEYTLTQTFRVPKKLLYLPNMILSYKGEEKQIVSSANREDDEENSQSIIARTNKELINIGSKLSEDNITYRWMNGSTVLKEMEVALLKVQKTIENSGKSINSFDFNNVNSFTECLESIEEESLMASLFFLSAHDYNFSDCYRKISLCFKNIDESSPIELITGHQSKGKEWDTVYIASDFFRSLEKAEDIEEFNELSNLLYVAVTRCKIKITNEHEVSNNVKKIFSEKSYAI